MQAFAVIFESMISSQLCAAMKTTTFPGIVPSAGDKLSISPVQLEVSYLGFVDGDEAVELHCRLTSWNPDVTDQLSSLESAGWHVCGMGPAPDAIFEEENDIATA